VKVGKPLSFTFTEKADDELRGRMERTLADRVAPAVPPRIDFSGKSSVFEGRIVAAVPSGG
jgi:hypothetical protein